MSDSDFMLGLFFGIAIGAGLVGGWGMFAVFVVWIIGSHILAIPLAHFIGWTRTKRAHQLFARARYKLFRM